MPIEQQMSELWTVIEGGAEVSQAEIVPFPSDVAGSTLEGVTETVELGNGVAAEVSQLTTVEAGATTATTAGVGLLAMDVGAVGLAIAPALGILAGVGLYELAPSFWDSVANTLIEAGETVGGKVRAFLNSDTKEVGFSEATLEIFKTAFLNAGLFNTSIEAGEVTQNSVQLNYTGAQSSLTLNKTNYDLLKSGFSNKCGIYRQDETRIANGGYFISYDEQTKSYYKNVYGLCYKISDGVLFRAFFEMDLPVGTYQGYLKYGNTENNYISSGAQRVQDFTIGEFTIRGILIDHHGDGLSDPNLTNDLALYGFTIDDIPFSSSVIQNDRFYLIWLIMNKIVSGNVQEGATLPSLERTIPQTYPTWTPWQLPSELPSIYPIELPVINPEAEQDTAQAPEALPDNNPDLLSWLLDNFPMPSPNPEPEPVPEPDPDPQPEPDPIEEPEDPTTDPDPVNPNPDPSPSPLPVVPEMPDTVPANAMFTVYKPTLAEVNSFGGWLWTASIIEQIKRIWNDPLQGIISFMKVYVDAPTTGTDTIKVGVLDSGVSSAVVSGQFVTVNCGTLNVSEKFFNATDYSPFVALHLYLPFIGIVELDIDEFMGGSISVVYHVDVYTGTCLAEVKATRTPDMPNATIVYTFSGNASQQLPLTSAEFSGAISALVGVVGGGLAIASGGGLGLLAGATGIAHAVTHEMVHVAHSGSLSANAGIMGARTPFLILTRRRGYDANGYNQIYGYPSNKTVFLNNCTGYVKVKDINLSTGATSQENDEIKELLLNGVIM